MSSHETDPQEYGHTIAAVNISDDSIDSDSIDNDSSSKSDSSAQGTFVVVTDDDYAVDSAFGEKEVNEESEVAKENNSLGDAASSYELFVLPLIRLFTHPRDHKQQWGLFVAFSVFEIVLGTQLVDVKWHWFPLYAFILLCISPYTKDPAAYFSGGLTSEAKANFSFLFLFSASFVAWLFAKSIQNSTALSYKFGLMGGIAYSGYYVGFWSTAIVVYRLRSQGYRSFMEAIADRYGYAACLSFSLALLYRLFSEIWSNAIVVGSFYGATQSAEWWCAVVAATVIPITYVLLGGQRSSLLSDVGHACLIVIFLAVVLSLLLPVMPMSLFDERLTSYTLVGGADQLCIAILQGALSYPFMDCGMTDRAFLGKPKAMALAFFCGGLSAMTFIFLFGFIGVFGRMLVLLPPAYATTEQFALGIFIKKAIAANANAVTATCIGAVGSTAFAFASLISVADTISTLDTCYLGTAKVTGVEIFGLLKYQQPLVIFKAKSLNVNIGRLCICLLAAGSLLFLVQTDQIALNATNATGTVVMGLGPAIWFLAFTPNRRMQFTGHRPLAFLLPFWAGVAIGVIFQASAINGASSTSSVFRNAGWSIGNGVYRDLLGANAYGACICWGLWFVGYYSWNRGEEHRLKSRDVQQQLLLEQEQQQQDALVASEKNDSSNSNSFAKEDNTHYADISDSDIGSKLELQLQPQHQQQHQEEQTEV